MSEIEKSYKILNDVLRNGAYLNIAVRSLDGDSDRPTVLKIVYGTAENFFSLSYFISTLAKNPPQPVIKIVLLQALYALKFMKIPPYAVVNESVELVKKLGKREQAGFVNALLKRAMTLDMPTPPKSDTRYLEVKYNLPSWLIALIKRQYPDNYLDILNASPKEEEHIRLGVGITSEEFEKLVPRFEKTECGYFVRNDEQVKKLFEDGKITYQSFTSIKAIDAMGDIKGKTLLDVCSAPGGKSVLASERGALVTACDVHPHRVQLINAYAKRMNVKLRTVVADATSENVDFHNRFDIVLCDVPCTGLGAINRRRDIVFKRTPDDIRTIIGEQKKILQQASKCVKRGGMLIYSTCTIVREENSDVIFSFLKSNPDFVLEKLPFCEEGQKQFLQNSNGIDGFYIARLRKV